MELDIGVVMDPIEKIKIKKDSTFAMLLEGQRRGHVLHYMTPGDIWVRNDRAFGRRRGLTVRDDPRGWFDYGEEHVGPLSELDVVLMRRDPPFDLEYINDTYVLERAEAEGVLVVNKPRALRDANEKFFTAWFARHCPPTLFSRDLQQLRSFVRQQDRSIVKPVDAMGGQSIFQLRRDDPNINVVLETLTQNGRKMIQAQRYIPEIDEGDKRILIVDGEAVPYALARIPGEGDFRGNLARGAKGKGVELSPSDWKICKALGPELKRRGILFAGLDVIGDYLTEINVTSPTCIRELDAIFDLNIAGMLFDSLEEKVRS